jgi:hypothetical protein
MPVHYSLTVSLLERKQEEKILTTFLREEHRNGVEETRLGIRLITGPEQGRRACQPRSVLG